MTTEDIKKTIQDLRSAITKEAFTPMPQDAAMMGGDPAMMAAQGVDPAMMGGGMAPPMDPAMMAAQGAPPPQGEDPLMEIVAAVEEMANVISAVQQENEQMIKQVQELSTRLAEFEGQQKLLMDILNQPGSVEPGM